MKEKVTKEQAKALSAFLEIEQILSERVKEYLQYVDTWKDFYLPLKEIGFDKFVRCLVNGYEVELTKEEKALNYYKTLDNYPSLFAIKRILDILEIKIKGVND
jgi:hypothetical protein